MNQALQESPEPRATYKSKYKPTWCKGCGDYSVLASLDKAFAKHGVPEHEITIVAGIGCSSRFPYFMETYGIHAAHGRALTVATGLKTARPDLTVVAVGGDGDALAIGGNHFFHTMRRNVDLLYILMDNQIYGMTKGQSAPTSRPGFRTKSTPYGVTETPVDPVWAALTMGATFVAQAGAFDPKTLKSLLVAGLQHKGLAFVNVLSPCTTFNKVMDSNYFKGRSVEPPEDYDTGDLMSALRLVRENEGRFPLGLLYQQHDTPTLGDGVAQVHDAAGANQDTLRALVAEFL